MQTQSCRHVVLLQFITAIQCAAAAAASKAGNSAAAAQSMARHCWCRGLCLLQRATALPPVLTLSMSATSASWIS